jgi:glycosyltransferase involved in cell wall biosynthesis
MTQFTIFVPVLNGEELILRTLNSIYDAAIVSEGQCEVKVVILDGNSTDSTLQIVLDWYSNLNNLGNFELDIKKKPDLGMYHALSRNIVNLQTGIVSYLNCGDVYENWVFVELARVFKYSEVNWVTGRNQYIDQMGAKHLMNLFVYRRVLIRLGVYGRIPFCPVIQQESTFWRSHLLQGINSNDFSNFTLAGDYYLWFYLSSKYQLESLNFPIASFLFHKKP